MKILRTPDERFDGLPGYPFEPNYAEVPAAGGGSLRIHHVDEGERGAETVLLMHGEPSWSYLYRKMIPPIVDAGFRVVAPDLVGFGRSDKPADRGDYTYQRHVDWMRAWLDRVDLQPVTLVCQDWGGLIGLRLVAENPDRFARVVASNTGLPTGDRPVADAFMKWREFSLEAPELDIGSIIQAATRTDLPDDVVAAYDAPFPDETYKQAARVFPSLVPVSPDDPSAPANRRAWESLSAFNKPFLTAFSDQDPITAGGDRVFRKLIPGARNQPHATIEGGGHFLQEDCAEQLARAVIDFIAKTG